MLTTIETSAIASSYNEDQLINFDIILKDELGEIIPNTGTEVITYNTGLFIDMDVSIINIAGEGIKGTINTGSVYEDKSITITVDISQFEFASVVITFDVIGILEGNISFTGDKTSKKLENVISDKTKERFEKIQRMGSEKDLYSNKDSKYNTLIIENKGTTNVYFKNKGSAIDSVGFPNGISILSGTGRSLYTDNWKDIELSAENGELVNLLIELF